MMNKEGYVQVLQRHLKSTVAQLGVPLGKWSWAQNKIESRNLFRAQTCNDLLLMPMISVSKPLTTIVTVLYMENQKQNESKYENNP